MYDILNSCQLYVCVCALYVIRQSFGMAAAAAMGWLCGGGQQSRVPTHTHAGLRGVVG